MNTIKPPFLFLFVIHLSRLSVCQSHILNLVFSIELEPCSQTSLGSNISSNITQENNPPSSIKTPKDSF